MFASAAKLMEKHSIMNKQKSDTNIKEYTPVSVCRDFAVIEFNGVFLGEAILWQAEIRTLSYHCQLHNITSTIRQFIDISEQKIESGPASAKLILGLNLPQIDRSTILSSIILVRQYKNLKPGLHQYGEIVNLQQGEGP